MLSTKSSMARCSLSDKGRGGSFVEVNVGRRMRAKSFLFSFLFLSCTLSEDEGIQVGRLGDLPSESLGTSASTGRPSVALESYRLLFFPDSGDDILNRPLDLPSHDPPP
jgi:hypothetical protein